MTTRQIEDCFEIDDKEEKEYTRYITLNIPKGTFAIVVDPYMMNMINMKDLVDMHLGAGRLIRARRPGWGRGNVQSFIHILGDNLCPLKSTNEL